MFCQKCGKKTEDTAEFCPYCGNKMNLTNNSYHPVAEKKGKVFKYISIICASLILFLGIISLIGSSFSSPAAYIIIFTAILHFLFIFKGHILFMIFSIVCAFIAFFINLGITLFVVLLSLISIICCFIYRKKNS